MEKGEKVTILYARKCLATTLKGTPCQRISYVDQEGRCPSHRDKKKFPISAATLKRMIEFELFWMTSHEHLNTVIEELADKTITEMKEQDRAFYDNLKALWDEDINTFPR